MWDGGMDLAGRSIMTRLSKKLLRGIYSSMIVN